MYQSVGASVTKYLDIQEPLELESGAKIGPLRIAYETYGRLNKDRSNAILVCHPLSGDAHAAGFHDGESRPGWWDIAIGPGKGFDTTKFFVICSNVLGGCKGTTGPSSIDPATGRPYGTSFPVVTIKDMVNAQKMLVDRLGITQLFAVAGGSMGGMQALQWAVSYPEMMRKAVVIASTAYSTPQQIAFNAVGRKAIISDPAWNKGDYYGRRPPSDGLSLARMVGHITYLSDESMLHKFGRNLQGKETVGFDFSTDFQVESYLNHQGDSFIKRFDPNSYLYITKAIDYFDLNVRGSLITGLSGVKAEVLVIGISSDWLYPPYQSQEIVTALRANGLKAFYGEIRSNYGHDAFLLEQGQLNYLLKSFLDQASAGDVMSRAVHTIREDTTIEKAAELMIHLETNHLPVVSHDDRLIGIVTSWDIAKAVARGLHDLREITTSPVVTTTLDEPVEEAVRKMEDNGISALPVVDRDNRVIGIVTNESMSYMLNKCR
ncbi:MAG TPA: homoserine O-acetyltransferase [Methanomassiliicoccaceae archaeon]|jgi:homoserine O-acetyltransferase|nr:homoserine O-acetyltransferase [Methanomassiliicoccaceae archaeon]HQD88473.1 homoserine O-acetyltransferase [Methanomassiliicoccaceae archaeon]